MHVQGGAHSATHLFREEYTIEFTSHFKHIHHLEAANLVAAITHLLHLDLFGWNIMVNTDKSASVDRFTTGKGLDPILLAFFILKILYCGDRS